MVSQVIKDALTDDDRERQLALALGRIEGMKDLIRDCQSVLAKYLPPDGISKDECISELLTLLDGPRGLQFSMPPEGEKNEKASD